MKHLRHNNIISFFLLAFIFTWIPWIFNIITGLSSESSAGFILIVIGSFGPAIAALLLLIKSSSETRFDYLKRLNPLRIKPSWYVLIIFLPFIILFFSVIISTIVSRNKFVFLELLPIDWFRENPVKLISYSFLILAFGPLPEELGWRGFVLDPLKNKLNGLYVSLIIATVWAVWHLPLFFINGYPLHESGMTGAELAFFFAKFIPFSIMFTWIFYSTGRSTISAILFHFTINYTALIFETSLTTKFVQACILFIIASIIVLIEKPIFIKREN